MFLCCTVLTVLIISALILSLPPLFKASQGDIGHAVGLLTIQPTEVQDPGEPQESGTPGVAWEGQKGTLGTKKSASFHYFHISK